MRSIEKALRNAHGVAALLFALLPLLAGPLLLDLGEGWTSLATAIAVAGAGLSAVSLVMRERKKIRRRFSKIARLGGGVDLSSSVANELERLREDLEALRIDGQQTVAAVLDVARRNDEMLTATGGIPILTDLAAHEARLRAFEKRVEAQIRLLEDSATANAATLEAMVGETARSSYKAVGREG